MPNPKGINQYTKGGGGAKRKGAKSGDSFYGRNKNSSNPAPKKSSSKDSFYGKNRNSSN